MAVRGRAPIRSGRASVRLLLKSRRLHLPFGDPHREWSIQKRFLGFLVLFLLVAFAAGDHPDLRGRGGLPPIKSGLAPPDRDLAAALERLRRFEHITRILYITAHPDDENAALLAYLSRGLGAEVALLTITRGEGGQNLMSPDQGPLLGLIRTEELLAADREYGIEQQFFTRAIDFGYTTRAQETLSRWGDPALADMVRVIRAYRPEVVISRWTGTILDGHGHHQAAGMLARHAVAAAADPNEYPDQLGRGSPPIESGLAPWRVARFFMEVPAPAPNTTAIPVASFSPERGKSYFEIGRAGYANHRTQFTRARRGGLERASRGGTAPPVYVRFVEENQPQPRMADFVERLDGLPLRYAFLEQKPDTPAGAAPVPSAAERLLAIHQAAERVRAFLLEAKAEDALRALAEMRAHLEALANDPVLDRLEPSDAARLRDIYERKQNELGALAAELAGLRVEAFAESPAVAGESILVRVILRANPEAHVGVPKSGEPGGAVSLRLPPGWQARPDGIGARLLPGGQAKRVTTEATAAGEGDIAAVFSVEVPADAVRLWPLAASDAIYEVADPWRAIGPRPVAIEAIVRFTAGGTTWEAPPVPVSVRGDAPEVSADRVLQPVPPFLLRLPDRMVIRHETGGTRRIVIPVAVRSLCDLAATGCRNPRLGAEAPEGWIVSVGRKISFARPDGTGSRAGDEALGQLVIVPPRSLAPGDYPLRCFVESEGKRYDVASTPYGYAGLAAQSYYHTAELTVRVMNLDVPQGLRIGYIAGPNDPVPAALERVGVTVDRLAENKLAFDDAAAFLRYDALVIGIRALELRPDILSRSGRWREYIEAGGTLVVQYQSPAVWNEAKLAPLPAAMDPQLPLRITDPKAPVLIRLPDHPLLMQPNRITAEDFDGWVAERGLSFLSRFDAQYQAPLAFRDAAGTETSGGLVYARVGKGIFIYTGLSFFRQLPAGVPGAYRLLINLISQGRYPRY